ncbi:hypothetical protein [Parasediminibacterium sp. JCM 36343]|uniref:hypothetical protein n=1 Tax=Parasediminibacterium sp. JCM 36343 TaxID=3374279 RepID=UPI00397B2C98
MITLSAFKNEINSLGNEDLEKIESIIKMEKTKRKINELVKEARLARLESLEGKTLVASNKEELLDVFKKMINNED